MSLIDKIKIYNRIRLEDTRGWFLKIIDGNEEGLPKSTGEIYLTCAKPGEIKGGHYHLEANEWFTLIKGKCKMILIDIFDNTKLELELDANFPKTIYVPNKIAHCFLNISMNDDFFLLVYSDRFYNPNDTIMVLDKFL